VYQLLIRCVLRAQRHCFGIRATESSKRFRFSRRKTAMALHTRHGKQLPIRLPLENQMLLT
jgi:hypothetical protein